MRLIHTATLRLEDFVGDDIPRYAILSHTWGREEVTFQDWANLRLAKKKAGYAKITGACQRARKQNISYLWVDTNCIDKTSSSELSEAINSMYAWYRKAEVCYAYLADVSPSTSREKILAEIRESRWFKRGWTLQELLAPAVVEFYSNVWSYLGTKLELAGELSRVTHINATYLRTPVLIRQASISERMSWAAGRETTRVEDLAYCLLGIFDISMALLYGEGPKAFLRLQDEIIKVSNDQSIFCWAHQSPAVPEDWDNLLAPSPAAFNRDSALCGTGYRKENQRVIAYRMTNAGLSIQLPVIHTMNGFFAFFDVSRRAAPNEIVTRFPNHIGIHFQNNLLQNTLNSEGKPARCPLLETPVAFPEEFLRGLPREELFIKCTPSYASSTGIEWYNSQLSKSKLHERNAESLLVSFNCKVRTGSSNSLPNMHVKHISSYPYTGFITAAQDGGHHTVVFAVATPWEETYFFCIGTKETVSGGRHWFVDAAPASSFAAQPATLGLEEFAQAKDKVVDWTASTYLDLLPGQAPTSTASAHKDGSDDGKDADLDFHTLSAALLPLTKDTTTGSRIALVHFMFDRPQLVNNPFRQYALHDLNRPHRAALLRARGTFEAMGFQLKHDMQDPQSTGNESSKRHPETDQAMSDG